MSALGDIVIVGPQRHIIFADRWLLINCVSFHVTVIDRSTTVIASILVTLILMRAGSVIRYKYKQRAGNSRM